MPNWCVNQVDISGDHKKVAELVAFVKGDFSDDDGNDFAFSKIVPPPSVDLYAADDNQNDFKCGCKREWITTKEAVGEPFTEGFVRGEGYWSVNGVAIEKQVLDNGTIKDAVGAAFGGVDVCPEHKVPQISSDPMWWYNWNVANWGTKWDARDVYQTDYTEGDEATQYQFDTAWSPAEPVVLALAEKFPELHITHRYCEGGMGFGGEVVYEGGSEIYRQEYDQAELPDGAVNEDYERNYDKVPMTPFERFAEEHFGGVVGG